MAKCIIWKINLEAWTFKESVFGYRKGQCPDRLWGTPLQLSNGYRGPFPLAQLFIIIVQNNCKYKKGLGNAGDQ
jgi:hypothetical protein